MKRKFSIARVIKYVVLTIISLVSIFPFVFMLFGMTSNTTDII